MKNIFLVCFFVFVAYTSGAQNYPTQTFDPPMCGNSGVDIFTFENFQVGNHGSGYRIFRNGVIVKEDGGDGVFNPSLSCMGIHFINESIGFAQIHGSTTYERLYKTTNGGNTWTWVGNNYWVTSSWDPSFYVVNANTVYAVIIWGTDQTAITELTSSEEVILDTAQTNDIYATDSIEGPPTCNEDTVHITTTINGVPVTYHINFVYEPLAITEIPASMGINAYPNPTENGSFKISGLPKQVNSLSLYSPLGQLIKEFDNSAIVNNNYDINELPEGFYFLVAQSDQRTYNTKLYKHN